MIRQLLARVNRQVVELTGYTPSMPKRIGFFDECELASPRFCGRLEGDRLTLARQILACPAMLETVLYREVYCSLLPPAVQPVPESGDLGLLCAYNHFDEIQRQWLLKVWQAVSPRRYYGDITYHAPLSFPLFNRVTQGAFLRIILPRLYDLEPSRRPLTSREFVELIETFMLNYASPLSEPELRILHVLQENPNATLQELQRRIQLSSGSLSTYMSGLKEKLLLSRFYRVNFPRIRLIHLAVLAYPAPGSRIDRYLEYCPYVRKIHRFGGAGSPYLVTYALPRLRVRRLREWLRELVGMGHLSRFRLYQLDGVFQGFNLTSYLAGDQGVPVAERFRWMAWIRYLREILINEGYGEVLEPPYIYRYSPPYEEPANLDPLDFQILVHTTPEGSAKELAKLLGVSVHVVRRRQKALFAKRVLFERPDLSMFHLGLNESLFVMLEGSEEVVHGFLAGCEEAPMYGGGVFSHPASGCIVSFGLPSGLALRVGRELSRLFLEQEDFDAAVFYGSGSKDFAVSPVLGRCRFDHERNQWVWHREYLPTTFHRVDVHHSRSYGEHGDEGVGVLSSLGEEAAEGYET